MEQAAVGGGGTVVSRARAAALIDALRVQEQLLGSVQARRAALMVEFGDVRRGLDQQVLGGLAGQGRDARYRAGEFAVTEISLAVTASKYGISRVLGMTRRLQAEAPAVWQAWAVGDIDHDKALRINRALRRLVLPASKALLNTLVVQVAPHLTPELLGRWLNQFIADAEPEQTDERLRRAFEDRYVSVRPDIDGMSFLHAALSCVDAAAIDQLLTVLAGVAAPGDDRTLAQRRADALVDVLCGRAGNGHHNGDSAGGPAGFDTNSDTDDHLDDPDSGQQHHGNDGDSRDGTIAGGPAEPQGGDGQGGDDTADRGTGGHGGDGGHAERGGEDGRVGCGGGEGSDQPADRADAGDVDEFDLPATAFRPDDRNTSGNHTADTADAGAADADPDAVGGAAGDSRADAAVGGGSGAEQAAGAAGTGTATPPRNITSTTASSTTPTCTCSCGHRQPPPPPALPVTIGIVVTASALFGYTNTPGQLADRSSLIPADIIRDLAAQPGTLFHRLITDTTGNLLDVTELGRFPSRKLGLAVRYRDPVCLTPTCHTPAHRSDLDHLIPVPAGPTTATNLGPECRTEHRAKTHGGHSITRTDPHTTQWTTPTGHTYTASDTPLPVDTWPTTTEPDPTTTADTATPDPAEPLPKHHKPERKRKRRRK